MIFQILRSFMFVASFLIIAIARFSDSATETATAVPIQDCGSEWATLTKLDINPPCGSDSCLVRGGERITVEANFVPKINFNQLYVTGYSKDFIFGVETFLWRDSVCSSRFNISCPIEANSVQRVFYSEVVTKNVPPNKIKIKIILSGDDNKILICKTAILEFRSSII